MGEIKNFIKICKKDQKQLKSWLYNQLGKYGYTPIAEDGFLFADGSEIMLTAHMDTVHERQVKQVVIEHHLEGTIISSPQGIGGDDRCGIYMILKLLAKGYRPTILFCEDEEIGGIGSKKFTQSDYASVLSSMKYIIELDRANSDDAVYYDCGNKDFQTYVESFGFKEAIGSFSDIGHLSPEGDVASVNLSCGYYKQHTKDEYVVFQEMETTIEKVANMLSDEPNVEKYDYQKILWKYNSWYDKWDTYDSYYDNGIYKDFFDILYNVDINGEIVKVVAEYDALTIEEAIGKFLMEHDTLTYQDIEYADQGDLFYGAYLGYDYIYEDELYYDNGELRNDILSRYHDDIDATA